MADYKKVDKATDKYTGKDFKNDIKAFGSNVKDKVTTAGKALKEAASHPVRAVKDALPEIQQAMNANQFGGMGNAAASNIAPQAQTSQEDVKAINEMEAATGMDLNPTNLNMNKSGLAENVPQELKDAGVSIKPEYQEAHPEVFNEQAVESGSAPAETYEAPTNTAVEEATADEDNGKTRGLVYEPTWKDKLHDWFRNKQDENLVKRQERQAKRQEDALNRVGVDEFGNTKQARNIMDAYLTGQISKDERNYYLADAFAKFAKDMGKNVGNVGAAFTGGAIDNSDSGNSAWQDRMSKLSENAAQTAAEKEGGVAGRLAKSQELDNQLKALQAQYTPDQIKAQIDLLNSQVDMAKGRTDILKQIDNSNAPDGIKALGKALITAGGLSTGMDLGKLLLMKGL